MTLNHNYNQKNKNKVRELIAEKAREYNFKTILTLESPQFLFSKLFPDKKIVVYEIDGDVIVQMKKTCPKNVELVFGNITKFGFFRKKADFVYLDFCGSWLKEKENIEKLKESIKNSKLFGLTICLRNGLSKGKVPIKEEDVFSGDYQFDLVNKLQSMTGINWKVIYGESYIDSVQMVTILLENPEASK